MFVSVFVFVFVFCVCFVFVFCVCVLCLCFVYVFFSGLVKSITSIKYYYLVSVITVQNIWFGKVSFQNDNQIIQGHTVHFCQNGPYSPFLKKKRRS